MLADSGFGRDEHAAELIGHLDDMHVGALLLATRDGDSLTRKRERLCAWTARAIGFAHVDEESLARARRREYETFMARPANTPLLRARCFAVPSARLLRLIGP